MIYNTVSVVKMCKEFKSDTATAIYNLILLLFAQPIANILKYKRQN